jgi:phosphatidate cytidylyltransferase
LAGRTELGKRLRAAMVLLAIFAAGLNADVFLFKRDICFLLLFTVAASFAFNEFCDLCEAWGIKPFRGFGIGGCIFLVLVQWCTLPHGRLLPDGTWAPLLAADYQKARPVLDAAVIVLIFVMFLRQAFIKDSSNALPALGMTLLGVVYVWFLAGFLLRIRHLGGDDWVVTGHGLLVATIFVSKVADVGAYFGGKKFGRHKLIPRISPGKSIEGAVFGLCSSVVMAFALLALGILPARTPGGAPAFGAAETVAFGLLVGGTGMCGDLFESILKRSGRHKDSSRMLPGYGGVLDVVDSVIISAPPAYLFLRLVAGLTMSGGG